MMVSMVTEVGVVRFAQRYSYNFTPFDRNITQHFLLKNIMRIVCVKLGIFYHFLESDI